MYQRRKFFIIGTVILAVIIATIYAAAPREEAPVMTRSVIFTDGYNGKDIASYNVEVGKGVDVPAAPKHDLYVFRGWFNYDNRKVKLENFDSILSDTHAIALYGYDFNSNGIIDDDEKQYTVKFVDSISGEVLEEENVLPGSNATAPELEEKAGYEFVGWDKEYTNIKNNLTVYTVYKKTTEEDENKYYTVTFVDGITNEVIKTVNVREGLSANTPKPKTHDKKLFDHWAGTYTNVAKNQTVKAIYTDDKNSNGIKDNSENHYTIKFVDNGNGKLNGTTEYNYVLEGLTFKEAGIVVPNTEPKNLYYKFNSWDKEFTKVTNDETYMAIFIPKNDLVGKTGPDGIADEEQKYTLTVNYVYYDGLIANTSYVWETNYNDRTYNIVTPSIKGHKPDVDVVSGTIGSDGKLDKVETVTYSPIKYQLNIVTGCSDERNCKLVEDAYNNSYRFGTKIKLPSYERRYTLTYIEDEYFNPNTSTEIVEKKLLGYCLGDKDCAGLIAPGSEISIPNEDVTYYAIYEGSLDVTLKNGRSYETDTYDHLFKTWDEYEAGSVVTLKNNKNVIARYDEVGHKYNLTIIYKFEDTGAATSEVKEVGYGENYKFIVNDVVGYTHEIKTIEGTMSNSDKTVEVLYKPKTGISYKIETYVMKLDGQTYDMTYEEIDGKTNEYIEIIPQYMDGFTFNTVTSKWKGTVSAEEELVLKLYYDRNRYNVTYQYTENVEGSPSLPSKELVLYEQTYTVKEKPTLDGYVFDGWYKGKSIVTKFKMPAGSVTLKGSFIKESSD